MKLKQYKSCADCRRAYEFKDMRREAYCNFGFPLEQLVSPIIRSVVIGDPNNDLIFEHKPKFGCAQKFYSGCPVFDFAKARELALGLQLCPCG